MRVLHVISSIDPRTGGTIATVVGLSQAQAALGMWLSVASTYHSGDNLVVREQLESAGVTVHLVGPAHGKLERHRDIRPVIESLVRDADIVHVHALWEEIQHQTARACQRLGRPYIMLPHGMLDPWSLAQRWLKKRAYMTFRLRRNLERAAALHYTTEIERDLTRRLHLHPPVIVEPPGLDLREFETLPPKGFLTGRYPQLAGKKIVLFLSRLHYKKGLELLIKAFARAALPDTALVIAGPDSEGYKAKLDALIADLQIGPQVIFTGMLHGTQRIAAFVDADLFALTSHQENFGIAVTEALAAGLPVLISDQVNIHREISQAGVGAVTSLDVDQISTALTKWMTDDVLRREAAVKARSWACERYDWKRIAERWMGHYQRLVSSSESLSGHATRRVPRIGGEATSSATASGSASSPARAIPFARDALRILHVISNIAPEIGGPVIALQGLASTQRRLGHRVAILTTWGGGFSWRYPAMLRDKGIEVSVIGPSHGKLGRHPDIPRVTQQMVGDADIVHIHALWEEVQHQAAQAAMRENVPYIIRPAGMLDPWSLSQHWLRKRLYMSWRLRRNLDRAAAVHFTSDLERDLVAPLGLTPLSVVEPNGIELAEFHQLPPKGQFRSTFPQTKDKPIVLFLSRLHYKKGLDLLIPAFAAAQTRNAILVIAGPDADGYRTRIERFIAAAGIEDRVLFTGMLHGEDRLAALVDADLFVLPSHQENFGVAVVEALAAGTPVIISDQVNIWREIQEAGVGGVVPLDVDALARMLTQWMSDDALRHAAAAKTISFAWDRYDWTHIAEHWVGHYRSILADYARRFPRQKLATEPAATV